MLYAPVLQIVVMMKTYPMLIDFARGTFRIVVLWFSLCYIEIRARHNDITRIGCSSPLLTCGNQDCT